MTIETMKKELKSMVIGKVMVKSTNKNYEESYYIHYDTPTPNNEKMINHIVNGYGFTATKTLVQSGSYGYKIFIRKEIDKKEAALTEEITHRKLLVNLINAITVNYESGSKEFSREQIIKLLDLRTTLTE